MRYSVVFAIALLMSVGTALPAAIAYVGDDLAVGVIDIATNTQIGTVSGANFADAYSIAVTPDATKAYVVNNTNNTVSVVNANTDAVIGLVSDPMTLFNSPFSMAITPDGSKAYVVNQGFPASVAVVNTLIDTATGLVVNPVLAFSAPFSIAITPDGAKAYVTNRNFVGYVSVIDVASNLVTGTVIDNSRTLIDCRAVAIKPDGTKAYVVNEDGTGGGGSSGAGSISIVNVATNTVTGYVSNGGDLFDLPRIIAIAPNGLKAYVGNFGSGTITAVNLATDTTTVSIDPGPGFQRPQSIAFSPDGTKAFVADDNDGCYVIDVATDVVTPVTGGPSFAYSVATYTRNNALPIADPSSASTVQFAPVTLTLTGSDADNNPLTFSIVTPPTHGVLTSLVSTGSFSAQTTYTPSGSYQGTDSFTFKVNDGYANSAPSLVTITITEINVGNDFANRLVQKYYDRVAPSMGA